MDKDRNPNLDYSHPLNEQGRRERCRILEKFQLLELASTRRGMFDANKNIRRKRRRVLTPPMAVAVMCVAMLAAALWNLAFDGTAISPASWGVLVVVSCVFGTWYLLGCSIVRHTYPVTMTTEYEVRQQVCDEIKRIMAENPTFIDALRDTGEPENLKLAKNMETLFQNPDYIF